MKILKRRKKTKKRRPYENSMRFWAQYFLYITKHYIETKDGEIKQRNKNRKLKQIRQIKMQKEKDKVTPKNENGEKNETIKQDIKKQKKNVT